MRPLHMRTARNTRCEVSRIQIQMNHVIIHSGSSCYFSIRVVCVGDLYMKRYNTPTCLMSLVLCSDETLHVNHILKCSLQDLMHPEQEKTRL